MKTAKNVNRIVMNQYLTPSPVFSRIESPLILSALLIGLLILTACGSAAVAPPAADPDPNKVTYSDWAGTAGAPKTTVIGAAGGTTTLPLLNGAASVGTSNPRGGFIQGLPTLDDKGFNFARTGFPDADVFGDVLLLEAGSPSGVAFSSVYGRGVTDNKGYAGLLPGTNLGAPITDINTSAIWDAKFAAIAVNSAGDVFRYSNPDFKMRVTFNGSTGEINSGTVLNGTFTAGAIDVPFTRDGTPSGSSGNWNIQGKFGRDGLLYGIVGTVPLTGLIGQNGAVGVFVNIFGTAGGFVAKPPVISPDANSNIVNYADWTRATTVKNADGIYGALPLLNGAASVSDANSRGNFVQGLATLNDRGFDFAGTDFSVALVRGDVLLLAENSPSGVAFSQVFDTGVTNVKYYAGLLPTTNLGAPITINNTSAIWNAGLMFASNRGVSINPSFKMQVTFINGAGTINSGTVSGAFSQGPVTTTPSNLNKNINIQGRFGRDGLLYGTVNVASTAGTLTGLIGQGGAVGAFVGDDFAGGFVAHPTNTFETVVVAPPPPSPQVVVFAQWAGLPVAPEATVLAGNSGTEPLLNGAASVGNTNPRVNFVQGLALSTEADEGFDFAGTPFSSASVHGGDVLLLEAGSPSGVAYSVVTDAVTYRKFYAGLLPGTNLGAPITDITTDAIWDAKLQAIFVNGSSVTRYSNPDFKMRVTFNGSAGEINSGTVSNGVFTAEGINVSATLNGEPDGNRNFSIQGQFGRDGLLYGSLGNNIPLTGLIGSGGAVGAFVSLTSSFAGGFVAKPPK